MIPDSSLSDGEFLLLGRFAILMMARNLRNTLVLLDEPETHLNDQWKVDLVKDLYDLLALEAHSSSPELLIAKHSDITLTDADPKQVYLFSTLGPRSKSEVSVGQPSISPFAANLSEISRVLFNTNGSTGKYSRALIERTLANGSIAELELLLHQVGPGFDRVRVRDRIFQLEHNGGFDR